MLAGKERSGVRSSEPAQIFLDTNTVYFALLCAFLMLMMSHFDLLSSLFSSLFLRTSGLPNAPIVSCVCRAAASHALSHRPDALACRSVQRRPNRAVLSATSAAMRRSLDHKCAAQVAYGCVRSVIYVAVGAQAYSAKHPRLVDPEFLRKLLSAFTTEVRR